MHDLQKGIKRLKIVYYFRMHSYLLIGNDKEKLKERSEKLAKKLHAKIMEFPLVKIDDVRALNNLIRLSFKEPTLVVSKNIHEAGEEALNAFLKNLEEPQENIYFALTAPTTRKVLPTIVSRCQIIRIMNEENGILDEEIRKFVNLSTGEKLAYIDKIKGREEAIEFAESLVNFLHSGLHENKVKYSSQISNIKVACETLTRLKGNGNVNLHLTNLVTKYG
jgi:DNA polymerase III delta prime subunit